jgi:hypothetical protein
MRRALLTAMMTLAWLLASPSLQPREAGWVEVGAVPAAAQEFRGIMVEEPARASRSTKKKTAAMASAKKTSTEKTTIRARAGPRGIVTSNQPGFHPMQPIEQPRITTTGPRTVVRPERDPRYPDVPTVPIIPRGSTGGAGIETSQDRIARCTHQGSLGGLTPGQQGSYVHNCAF